MDEVYPRLYLDTNILISYIHEREDASVNLLKRIKSNKWSCVTSSFTWLEIYDVERLEAWVQARRMKHWMYDQIMRNYRKRFSKKLGLTDEQLLSVHTTIRDWLISFEGYIDFQRLNDEISINAERLCAIANIAGADALHLATAMHRECNILVTNDDDFLGSVKQLRIEEPNKYPRATKAKEFDKTLNEYLHSKGKEDANKKG